MESRPMNIVRIAALLATVSLATVLLPPAALAQSAADQGEAAATAECKAKSDPSILLNYWKTAGTRSSTASAELENLAKRICALQGGGNSHSYKIAGNAGPMAVTGTACSLAKPFTVEGSGGGMFITFSYAPASETGGAVSYAGGGTGSLAMVRMAGKGTYTVKLDDKGGTLTQTHTGAVTNPGGGSATHTDTLKLTPTGPC
jgi:hypothetical protein